MALTKKILKNSPREVIVKWIGSGADTLSLASLVATGQTLTGGVVPCVNIIGLISSVQPGGFSTITRNSEIALNVYDNFELSPYTANDVVINENSSSDIVVSLSTNGTLILKLRKIQGYSDVGTGL